MWFLWQHITVPARRSPTSDIFHSLRQFSMFPPPPPHPAPLLNKPASIVVQTWCAGVSLRALRCESGNFEREKRPPPCHSGRVLSNGSVKVAASVHFFRNRLVSEYCAHLAASADPVAYV
ncbi:unnamed protein product, partial [Iphiclides podalirius]